MKVERLHFKNYPNVDPEEVQRILEKDRAERLAQRVASERIAAERAAAAKASQQQQQQQAEAAALQSVIVPKLLIPSPFKPKAVMTTTTHHFSPQTKAEYDQMAAKYDAIMSRVNRDSGTAKNLIIYFNNCVKEDEKIP